MKRIAGILFALAAWGCAQQPSTPSFTPQPAGESNDPRSRAQIHTELGAQYFGIGQFGVALEEANEALRADPVRSAEILGRIPAGRWGTPEDLQAAVVFLASPASDYMHGSTLAVDGGWLAR